MPILGTFKGNNILAMPAAPAPRSVEWSATDIAAVSTSPFTGEQQILDWQASFLSATVTLPPLTSAQAQVWVAWMLAVRGPVATFLFADLAHRTPLGAALGAPVVAGSTQSGYNLVTRGWTASSVDVLMPGDWLQIGYRLYRNLEAVNADAAGNATLSIWPNLRESPSDGSPLLLTNTSGLFRLKAATRKWSVSEALVYGINFDIIEAL